ncbi:MAG: sigma-70 family RNA polymerase sigma factor [Candidatus Kapaibacterium sp.]|nr:MAG: sigma-70 family RNA polymerase sigma factor [Candidatus Kapabacteria bacterium]
MIGRHSQESSVSDEDLWSECVRDGNGNAFRALYDRYFQQLYRYGYHLTPQREAVQDAVQNLFVYLYEHQQSIGEIRSFRAYIFTSFRRTLARNIKQERKYVADEYLLNADSDAIYNDPRIAAGFLFELSPSVEEIFSQKESTAEQRNKLLASINQLPKRQREVLYLHYFEELSSGEIAAAMEVKVETVYITLHRAIHSLQEYLQGSSLLVLLHCLSFLLS